MGSAVRFGRITFRFLPNLGTRQNEDCCFSLKAKRLSQNCCVTHNINVL